MVRAVHKIELNYEVLFVGHADSFPTKEGSKTQFNPVIVRRYSGGSGKAHIDSGLLFVHPYPFRRLEFFFTDPMCWEEAGGIRLDSLGDSDRFKNCGQPGAWALRIAVDVPAPIQSNLYRDPYLLAGAHPSWMGRHPNL
jgi:hypothetical protein